MSEALPSGDAFHGLFARRGTSLIPHPDRPATLPDPNTGVDLRIATVESGGAICPSCTQRADGGFISFVADMRLVFACPLCSQLVWLKGA